MLPTTSMRSTLASARASGSVVTHRGGEARTAGHEAASCTSRAPAEAALSSASRDNRAHIRGLPTSGIPPAARPTPRSTPRSTATPSSERLHEASAPRSRGEQSRRRVRDRRNTAMSSNAGGGGPSGSSRGTRSPAQTVDGRRCGAGRRVWRSRAARRPPCVASPTCARRPPPHRCADLHSRPDALCFAVSPRARRSRQSLRRRAACRRPPPPRRL